MRRLRVAFDREELARICRRNGIRRLAVFGSVLSNDFRADSDVDVLVEFQPDVTVGLRFFDIQDELSRLLGGRRVDLVRTKYLNCRLRDRILAEAETQYAEG